MYIETIYRVYCPKCKVVNYVENGCVDDITVCDVEGVQCHKCRHKFRLDGEDDDKDGDFDEDDTTLYEEGMARLE